MEENCWYGICAIISHTIHCLVRAITLLFSRYVTAVASLGGRRGRCLPRVSPFWDDTILWSETISQLICGEDVFPSSFELKTNRCSGEDLCFCFGIRIFLGRKLAILTAIIFFLVFTYFWTEKGWPNEIPPRVPPSLATPLCNSSLEPLPLFFISCCLVSIYFSSY